MPTQSSRPSLKTDILSRFENQRVGSAFDAKNHTGGDFGHQEKLWTKPGFVKNEELGTGGRNKLEQSLFLQGFTNQKYKG